MKARSQRPERAKPKAAAQREPAPRLGAADSMASNPRLDAQREALHAAFGAALQRQLGQQVGARPATVAQLRDMKLRLSAPGIGAASRIQPLVQRVRIDIGTESGTGTLTYSEDGTIHATDGTPFRGMILVLIQIPRADRGKGHGAGLMSYFMENRVKDRPCYLDVKATDDAGLSNDELVRWYRKFGFTVVGYSDSGPVMGVNVPRLREPARRPAAVKLVDYPDSD